jgi:hypothetical protein
MSSKVAHLEYQNSEITIRAIKRIPNVETPGITIREVQEGVEFTVLFWVAKILVEHGLAEYIEPSVTQTEWTQVHYRERLNPAGPPTTLPDGFYERAYQTFIQSRISEDQDPTINRMKAWFRDILESRIGRITRTASSSASSPISLLHKAEGHLYDEVHRVIQGWRKKMRSIGEE